MTKDERGHSMVEFNRLESTRGVQLEYLISRPHTFDPSKSYPTLLALPPGEQSRDLVRVYEGWLPFFQERGWVFCSPAAPEGKLFFRGSERYLPLIMDDIESQVKLAGGKFYLFGVSNGGISAFRAATLHPERFHSLTVLPGWPKPADEKRLDKVLHLPINFLVGELDDRWLNKSEMFHKKILEMGGDSTLEVLTDQGHMAFHSIDLGKLKRIIQPAP